MPIAPIKPTAAAIDALKPTGKREDIRFAKRAAPNLLLRMGTTGALSWRFVAKVGGRNYVSTFGPVRRLANGKVDPVNVQEALAWAAQQRAAVQSGVNVLQVKRAAREAATLGEVWEDFLQGRARKKRPSSRRADARTWADYIAPEFADVKVGDIDRGAVKAFLDRTYTAILEHPQASNGSRVNSVRALLSVLMTEAVQAGHIDANPVRAVPAYKVERAARPELSEAQRQALLEAADAHSEHWGLIVEIALITGLRLSNIVEARWDHIAGERWTIPATIMKGKHDHVIILPEATRERLEAWRARPAMLTQEGHVGTPLRRTGWVFPSTATKYAHTPEADRPSLSTSIKTAWGRIRKAAKLPPGFTFHGQRHDFATQAARAGASQYDLQKAMGHRDYRMTQGYIAAASTEGAAQILADRAAALAKSKGKGKLHKLPTA